LKANQAMRFEVRINQEIERRHTQFRGRASLMPQGP
jgi:hypothetical protein